MTPDRIALALTTERDRVYPPMRWVARWSTGTNIPLGLNRGALAAALQIPDWYDQGLWLISEQGHGQLLEGFGPAYDGASVTAWSGIEARARLALLVPPDVQDRRESAIPTNPPSPPAAS